MANKAKKGNKNMVIGLCATVAVIIVVVVAVVLAINSNKLNDSYFVSDGTKYVLTINSDESLVKEGELVALKTHIVYNYSGDEITGMKSYAEFKDAETAQKAYDAIKNAGEDMTNYSIDGKYVIMTATPDQYKGMTATDVKAQIEFMENLKNNADTNTNESNSSGEGTTVETTENK